MAYDDFKAGWEAAHRFNTHDEWGPEPPKTPEAAWRAYKGLPEPLPTYACPACGTEPMVKRLNRREGTTFYGCTNFPVCRGTRDISGDDQISRHTSRFDYSYDESGDDPDLDYDGWWYDQEF